jgi:hypothetical protein
MGRFRDQGEPEAVMVVWAANGDVCVKTNCVHTHAIGLARFAEAKAMAAILSQSEAPIPAKEAQLN